MDYKQEGAEDEDNPRYRQAVPAGTMVRITASKGFMPEERQFPLQKLLY
jgi:hypothetical protein